MFLRMYHENLKHLSSTKSIEVAEPKIGGLDTQKSPFSGFTLRFSQEPPMN